MNSDFQKRLFQFQARPPAGTWKEIAAALDEEKPAFAGRLFRYQLMPAKNIWSQISGRLAGTVPEPARTVPMRKKWVAYAAAAVFMGLAGYGIYLMMPADRTQAVTPAAATPSATTPEPVRTSRAIPENPVTGDTTTGTIAAAAPDPGFKKRNISRHLTARLAPSVRKPQLSWNAAKNEVPLREKTIVNASRADRYMIATTYDGSVVRLPKKAYAAFACVDMPDIACREKIASMQNKMANASLTTDFAGFLDLLNNLQDQ